MSQTLPASGRLRGRLAAGLRTVLMMAVCVLGSLLAVGTAIGRFDEDASAGGMGGLENVVIGLALLGGLAAAVALVWRHTHPYAVTLVCAGLVLVLPLDATALLFALAALIRGRSGERVWVTAGGVGLVTVWVLYRDAGGQTSQSSFLKSVLSPVDSQAAAPVDLSWWTPLLIGLLLVGAAVGAGLFMRSRVDLAATREQMVTEQVSRVRLTEQVGRQAERELIAREVHDVIGHRLSLLSLHAGGLEVAAEGDPRLAGSAALVRQSAQATMDDLRSLLEVLRQPELAGESRTATPSLADLPTVIDETVASGMHVVSTVYLDHAGEADEALARAVYRIVQELLTNARRHAPGAPVRLLVQGGPGDGVRIETANQPTGGAVRPAGNGLTGVTERAELLGGGVQHGVDDQGAFRVSVWLPW